MAKPLPERAIEDGGGGGCGGGSTGPVTSPTTKASDVHGKDDHAGDEVSVGDDNDNDDDDDDDDNDDNGDDDDAALLVTHGACSNILYEVLTGSPPARMATVGSFFMLERPVEGGDPYWRDTNGQVGEAAAAHLVDRGNAAH